MKTGKIILHSFATLILHERDNFESGKMNGFFSMATRNFSYIYDFLWMLELFHPFIVFSANDKSGDDDDMY